MSSTSVPFPSIDVKTVLVATDLRESSEKTLEHGIAIARHFGAILYLVHVVSSLGFTLAGPEAIELAANASHRDILALVHQLSASGRLDGVDVRPYILSGNIDDEIGCFSQAHCVDLIVAGSHEGTGIGKLVLGSLAQRIARQCCCPVLTVGPQACGPWLDNAADREKPLLLAISSDIASGNTMPFALALASHFERPLSVLHVIPRRQSSIRKQARPAHDGNGPWLKAQATALVSGGGNANEAFASVPVTCDSAEGILDAAERIRAATIVVAERCNARSYLRSLHSRNVFDHVNREAKCPVLTIRA